MKILEVIQNNASYEFKLFKDTLNAVRLECDDFMEYARAYGMLYRGTRRLSGIFQEYPRDDREPVSMYPSIQHKMDNVLRKAGFSALRSNSFFVTGSRDSAFAYGKVYYVFPKNGFDFTWSARYSDLYDEDEFLSTLDYTEYRQVIQNGKFYDDNLGAAIKSGHEIYILGECIFIAESLVETYSEYFEQWLAGEGYR